MGKRHVDVARVEHLQLGEPCHVSQPCRPPGPPLRRLASIGSGPLEIMRSTADLERSTTGSNANRAASIRASIMATAGVK